MARKPSPASVAEVSKDNAEILLALARGEREIEAGHGFSLQQVLAAADEILTRRREVKP